MDTYNFKQFTYAIILGVAAMALGAPLYYKLGSTVQKTGFSEVPLSNQSQCPIMPSQAPIKAVLCDIGGVLLKTSTSKVVRQIGIGNVLSYAWQGGSLSQVKPKIYSFIDYMTEQEGTGSTDNRVPTYDGHALPLTMVRWQKGEVSNDQMLSTALGYIDEMDAKNHFKQPGEKDFMIKLAHMILESEQQAHTKREIKPITKIVRRLAQQKNETGDKAYKLIVISNMEADLIHELRQKFANLFDLFDDIIASGEVGLIKPNPDIYEHVLKKHNLKPEECVFMDDLIENIEGARALGINAIRINKKNCQPVRKKLQHLGISLA